MAIIIKPPVSGGGAVDSVNGQTGVVVLTTDNINAGSNADRQYFTSSIQSDIDSKADQSSLDTVQSKTLYSNSYYVNEGVNDIQDIVNDISGGSGAYAIYISAGSYAGSTLTINNAPSGMDIIAPYHPTSGHICELVSRGITISGASTTRIRISDLNIEGALLIDGSQGRHYFKNCIFDSTVTITNSTANFITFEQCSFAGAISIASSVTATVYFDRCALGNQFVTSSRTGAGSPLLTVLTECSGLNSSQTNLTSNVALVGRTGLNSGIVTQYQNADSYVYDLNNGLSTSFSGSYTELRNKPSIASNTDGLTEGSTNLYFTTSRARASFSAGAGISISSGQISSTITQYADADADARIALQKGANNGICELDANGLVPTNHLPPLAITDVHVVADEAARLALVAQEGDVAIQSDNSSSWIYDGSTWVQFGLSGGVLSVNGQTGTVSLDTDDITEGGSNLYYTNTRFDTRLATKTTDNLTEGSTNLYFTTSRARASFSAGTGITIVDGQISSSISSYSDEQARDAAGSALANGVHTGISFINNDALDRIDATVSLAGFTTDNLNEGSTNLYYTSTRVNSAFDTRLATKTTDNLTEGSTNLYYTNTRFDTRLATKTTDNLTEGSTNLYYTSTRVNSAFDTRLATKTTDNLTEGSTNLYFTTSRARASFSAGSNITIVDGVISSTSSGASRPTYSTISSFPLTISAPASTVVKERYYLNNGSSAVTVNLPAIATCDGLELTIKLLGTGTATIDASGSETIDGALTFALTLQNSSINLVATASGWRIE
jgi:hypothetical protein